MISRAYGTDGARANAGAVVVLDVKDGSVLASANYPSFDQNLYATQYSEYSADPGMPLFNRALQGLYTPGSTYKPSVAVAALDTGVINRYSTVYCNGVYNYFQDYHPKLHPPRPLGQHRRHHGHQMELQHLLLRCGPPGDQ